MLPLLEELLPTILPLLKRRDTYYAMVIALLAFLLWSSRVNEANESAALAARANVRSHVEVVTKTVRLAGQVHYETKTVYVPGKPGEVEYVERIVTRDPIVTTTSSDKTLDKAVTQACPAAAPGPWRSMGVLIVPTETYKIVGVRGSATLKKTFELGAEMRLVPHPEGVIEAGVRF